MAHLKFTDIETPRGTFQVLDSKPNGECVHLTETGCGVYENRPLVCASYDCRKQFLILSRNDRRQFTNQEIWSEARNRLNSLDVFDRAELEAYRSKARRTMESIGL